MSDLAQKKCAPCQGGSPRLDNIRIEELLKQIDGWAVENQHHLMRTYRFPDFVRALVAVNRIGAIAEQEGHHPDIFLTWGQVGVKIWTHSIDGLSESDFILAAKIDRTLSAGFG